MQAQFNIHADYDAFSDDSGTVTVTTGAAYKIIKVSGDSQSATVNAALTNPLVVRLADAFGNPVSTAGVSISYSVTTKPLGSAYGTFGNASPQLTDASGEISVDYTVGDLAGLYSVNFSSVGLLDLLSQPSQQPFTVTGVALGVSAPPYIAMLTPADVIGDTTQTVTIQWVVDTSINAANTMNAALAGDKNNYCVLRYENPLDQSCLTPQTASYNPATKKTTLTFQYDVGLDYYDIRNDDDSTYSVEATGITDTDTPPNATSPNPYVTNAVDITP